MKTRILFLPIETIARELDGKLLLAHRALARGYKVIIGRKSDTKKAAENLGYGIYMYKDHNFHPFPNALGNDKKEFKYVALDEEGLVFNDNEAYLKRAMPHNVEHLDLIFTWGNYQKNLLIKENPELLKKTIAVGNPRFDLLRSNFKVLREGKTNSLIEQWGSYVIVNTNFAAGNLSHYYNCSYIKKQERSALKYLGRPLSDKERSFYQGKEVYYKNLFFSYIEMLEELSSRFPFIQFILRPHPSEDIENWRKNVEGLNNVHVVFEGSATEWMQGALAVIHTGCTTGIEGRTLQKPVFSYNPNPDYRHQSFLPDKFGYKVEDIETLCILLSNVVNNSNSFVKEQYNKQLGEAKQWIENITGPLAAERILDSLDNIFDRSSNRNYKKEDMDCIKYKMTNKNKQFIKNDTKSFIKIVKKTVGFFIKKLYRSDRKKSASTQKFTSIKPHDIESKLAIFDSIFSGEGKANYIIDRISESTFLIRKPIKRI